MERNVSVKLSANIAAYKSAMSQAKSATSELEGKVDKVGSDLDKLGSTRARPVVDLQNNATAELNDVEAQLDDLTPAASDAGQSAGSALGAGLKGAFAAAGVAAVVGEAFNDALSIEAGMARVQGQFALTAGEAARYGKMGGDLYASAWGESVTDATASIAKVGQQLADVGDIAESELSAITSQVMAVSDVFGQDFDAVVRSAGNLLRNGLATDAEHALDIITVGFQNGNDRAGDMLDTIDEYAPYWQSLGISGEEALGLIQVGFQNGMRDADKLADSLKEFNIKVLEEESLAFFDALGLAGGQLQTQFGQGGEAARDALDQVIDALAGVEDPIERNRIAVGLFGTMWEDLGPRALETLQSLETGLGDVAGASEEMAETVSNNTATAIEEMNRRIQTSLADTAADFIPLIEAAENLSDGKFRDAASDLDSLLGVMEYFDPTAKGAAIAGDLFAGAFGRAAETTGRLGSSITDATTDIEGLGGAADDAAPTIDSMGGHLNHVESSAADAAAAIDAAADATAAYVDAVLGALSTQFDYERGVIAVQEAMWDLADAEANHIAVMGDSKSSDREKAESLYAVREAQMAGVDQIVATAAAYATEQGAIEGTTEHLDIQRDALLMLAGENPALRDQIMQTIARMDEVSEVDMSTEITTDASQAEGEITSIDRMMNGINGKVATTTIRTVREMITNFQTTGNQYGVGNSKGGFYGGNRAGGGPVKVGRLYEVGEGNVAEMFMSGGKQYMIPGNDGNVIGGAQLKAAQGNAVASASSSGGLTINHYGPRLSAGDVARGYKLARLAQV